MRILDTNTTKRIINNKDMMHDNKKMIDRFIEADSAGVTAAKIILVLAASGLLVFAGAALPGVLNIANKLQGKKYDRIKFRNALRNLKSRKLLEIVSDKNGVSRVVITTNGKKRIKDFDFERLSISTPKKWDGKWHVLIFDIPSNKTYNRARDAMRFKIKELGFYQLQKSVWIHPYPCEDEILLVAENFNVQKHVEMLTVEKFFHENLIRKKFDL